MSGDKFQVWPVLAAIDNRHLYPAWGHRRGFALVKQPPEQSFDSRIIHFQRVVEDHQGDVPRHSLAQPAQWVLAQAPGEIVGQPVCSQVNPVRERDQQGAVSGRLEARKVHGGPE
jgi:hypothetical protein